MKELDEEQILIRQYLLGDINEAEREAVEERMITDRNYLEKVRIVESEIMDEYVRGALSEGDEAKFKARLLSTPKQMRKLKFAIALTKYIKVVATANSPPITKGANEPNFLKRFFPKSDHQNNWAMFLLRAAFVGLIAAITIIVAMRIIGPSEKREALEREVAELNARLSQSPEEAAQTFVVGPLNPGVFRDSGEMKKVAIPDAADVIQLQIKVDAGGYDIYKATLKKIDGDEILTIGNLKDHTINGNRLVTLYIPSRILSLGDYEIILRGLNSNNEFEYIDKYMFRVVGK